MSLGAYVLRSSDLTMPWHFIPWVPAASRVITTVVATKQSSSPMTLAFNDTALDLSF